MTYHGNREETIGLEQQKMRTEGLSMGNWEYQELGLITRLLIAGSASTQLV